MGLNLNEIEDGYYIYARGGLTKVPQWVYKVARAVGATVAHSWSREMTLDEFEAYNDSLPPEEQYLYIDSEQLDDEIQKLTERYGKGD